MNGLQSAESKSKGLNSLERSVKVAYLPQATLWKALAKNSFTEATRIVVGNSNLLLIHSTSLAAIRKSSVHRLSTSPSMAVLQTTKDMWAEFLRSPRIKEPTSTWTNQHLISIKEVLSSPTAWPKITLMSNPSSLGRIPTQVTHPSSNTRRHLAPKIITIDRRLNSNSKCLNLLTTIWVLDYGQTLLTSIWSNKWTLSPPTLEGIKDPSPVNKWCQCAGQVASEQRARWAVTKWWPPTTVFKIIGTRKEVFSSWKKGCHQGTNLPKIRHLTMVTCGSRRVRGTALSI